VNFLVEVSKTTTNKEVKDMFVDVITAQLLAFNLILVRRELELSEGATPKSIRSLQENGNGLPNNCFIVEDGISDEQCQALSEGTSFSYKCDDGRGYVCCKNKEGNKIETGSLAGKCARNADSTINIDTDKVNEKKDLGFDPEVTSTTARAVTVDCAESGIVVKEGNKCVIVTITLTGPEGGELVTYKEIIEDSVKTIQADLIANGMQSTVALIVTTPEPTNNPTIRPTNKPTGRPTILVDPCPALSGDCNGCIESGCSWCTENSVCVNVNQGQSLSSGASNIGGISRLRFLQEECLGTVSNDELICEIETTSLSPSISPSGNATSNTTDPNTKSNACSLSTTRNSVFSLVASVILLSLA